MTPVGKRDTALPGEEPLGKREEDIPSGTSGNGNGESGPVLPDTANIRIGISGMSVRYNLITAGDGEIS